MKKKYLSIAMILGILVIVVTFFIAAQFHIIKKSPSNEVTLGGKSEILLPESGGRLFLEDIDTLNGKLPNEKMLNIEFSGKTYELFRARKEASMEVFVIDNNKQILIFKDVELGGSSGSVNSEIIVTDKSDNSVSIVDISEIIGGFDFTCSYPSIGLLDSSVGIYYSNEGCDALDFFSSFTSRKLTELPLIKVSF